MTRSTETFATGLDFAEGPRWHGGRLWLSDFYARRVYSYGPNGDRRVEVELDDRPSGLGWLPSGELLVVAMASRQVRRVDHDGEQHVHADLTSIATGDCNDMVVDGRGNAYIGNFGFDMEAGERPKEAALSLVRADGTVEVAAEDLRFPNGSVITPDDSTLIVGESMGARYTAFSIGDDGRLSDRRTWAEVPGKGPDGCALDAGGLIWMADAFGSGCLRVAEGGEIVESIVASQPVYACALGGTDQRTLYMMTAPGFGESVCSGKGLGRIETIQVEVPGAGWP
jgi:sugar lactone lactonase YvrE